MSEIKDAAAAAAVEPEDVTEDDQTLDWDTKRLGRMIDQRTEDEPLTVPAGSGDEEGE